MAIVSRVYTKCGHCQLDPQNVAIVRRIYSNCDYCQIGVKMWLLSVRSRACDHCQLGVFPQNVAIFSTVLIKCGHCQLGPQNVAIAWQNVDNMWKHQ